MTATDTEAMSALQELLDERQRYQGWLATLEGRRNSTPPHVYERVQQDYVSRLDHVMQSLAERAGQLTGTIQTMTAELSSLREHESTRSDERHESELRAAVGEFTPDDWERRRAEADGDLERIAAERHSLEGELQELERIVALTQSIKPETAAVQPVSDTGGAASPRESLPQSPSAQSGPSIDDFIAEWHPAQGRQQPGSPAKAAHGEGNSDDSDLGDLIIPAASMGGNPVGAAGADYGIANGVTGGAGGMTPTRTPQVARAAIGDSLRDTDKTLKCPECGTMNYATEWYCERCGGELSTF
jgi:predicted  nucleic acid-binding Zn-ribbon protein